MTPQKDLSQFKAEIEKPFPVSYETAIGLLNLAERLQAELSAIKEMTEAKRKYVETCNHPPEVVIGSEDGYICCECWAIEEKAEADRLAEILGKVRCCAIFYKDTVPATSMSYDAKHVCADILTILERMYEDPDSGKQSNVPDYEDGSFDDDEDSMR